jgi:hypothetical protein
MVVNIIYITLYNKIIFMCKHLRRVISRYRNRRDMWTVWRNTGGIRRYYRWRRSRLRNYRRVGRIIRSRE